MGPHMRESTIRHADKGQDDCTQEDEETYRYELVVDLCAQEVQLSISHHFVTVVPSWRRLSSAFPSLPPKEPSPAPIRRQVTPTRRFTS